MIKEENGKIILCTSLCELNIVDIVHTLDEKKSETFETFLKDIKSNYGGWNEASLEKKGEILEFFPFRPQIVRPDSNVNGYS